MPVEVLSSFTQPLLYVSVFMAFILQRSGTSLVHRGLCNTINTSARANKVREASNRTTTKSDQQKDSTDLPRFSLKDLNMSTGTKVVVYGALTVLATAETVTYGTWAYQKLYPDKDQEQKSNEEP